MSDESDKEAIRKMLSTIPAEERERLAAGLVKFLLRVDADDPPEPLPMLPLGTQRCPSCRARLTELGVIPFSQANSGQLLFVGCLACRDGFYQEIETGVQ